MRPPRGAAVAHSEEEVNEESNWKQSLSNTHSDVRSFEDQLETPHNNVDKVDQLQSKP